MADATREAGMRLGKPQWSVPDILSILSCLLGHSADVRRGACVLLYLQRADYARCRGCCEPQPLRGIAATEDAGLATVRSRYDDTRPRAVRPPPRHRMTSSAGGGGRDVQGHASWLEMA